jgi:hypothetical protein
VVTVPEVLEVRPSRCTLLLVASVLADQATELGAGTTRPFPKVAGSRVDYLPDLIGLYVARHGGAPQNVVADHPADPDRELDKPDLLLPGPGAILGGPTFEQWLTSTPEMSTPEPRPAGSRA